MIRDSLVRLCCALHLDGTVQEPDVRASRVVLDAAAAVVELLAVEEVADLGIVHDLDRLPGVPVVRSRAVSHGYAEMLLAVLEKGATRLLTTPKLLIDYPQIAALIVSIQATVISPRTGAKHIATNLH